MTGQLEMTIYTFSSTRNAALFAFSADRQGANLPDQHGPWTLQGGLHAQEAPPHRFERSKIESALVDGGFQLWRVKKRAE
jgi:hypothetical protein